MANKHLEKLSFYWHVPGLTGVEVKRTSAQQKIVTDVDNKVRDTIVLTAYIEGALKAAKVQVGDTPIRWAWMALKKEAKAEPYFDPEPPYLYADIPYDPLDLLYLPKDKGYIGELYIGWVEDALSKLESIPGFPCEVIREACEKFRRNKYTYTFKAGEKMIPGTRIKGRIWVVSSGLGTQRHFEALYRNKSLFSKKISENNDVELTISGRFSGFEYENGIVTVPGDQYDPFPEEEGPDWMKPVSIDLREHPETFELMREKGWVT